MNLVDLSLIQVSLNRQRRTFNLGELSELSESIKKHGLFHPIVVREEEDEFFLVSGERRFRAITDIFELGDTFRFNGAEVQKGFIPYVTLGELTSLARWEAELEENIRRIDLPWEERAEATEELMRLRSAQAVEEGKPAPTVTDISIEVRNAPAGTNWETTRREILVAPHLKDPEIRGAKNVDEAFKILRKREETGRRERLAAQIGDTFGTLHTVHNCNSLDWMQQHEDGKFDVILTDPPYGIGADSFGDAGGRLLDQNHGYEDSKEYWYECMRVLAREGFRITKPAAHIYMFCDVDNFVEARQIFSTFGWQVHRTPLIDYKLDAVRVPWPEHGPRRCWEMILYAIKGGKRITQIYSDVIPCRGDENLGSGAQKPVALYVDLLRRSVSPGDTVLDPFAGTGPIFPAAEELKCRATGIERREDHFAVCVERIEKLKEA